MAGRLPRTFHGPFWGLRRAIRHPSDDRASGAIVSFIVGASVFLLSTTVLIHFIAQPPGAGSQALTQDALKSRATESLGLLLGSTGYPVSWSTSASGIDAVQRLGLLEEGSTIRIDPAKYYALLHGRLLGGSSTNGYVDYSEAASAMGLGDYSFHITTSPSAGSTAGVGSLARIGTFPVAYLGSAAQPAEATTEAATLAAILPQFGASSDRYQDTLLRTTLFPKLGGRFVETVLNPGVGTSYGFQRVSPASIGTQTTTTTGYALALADENGAIGYTPGRESRVVVAIADLSAEATSAAIQWSEVVDANGDLNDHGYVEVSPDNGATWVALNDVPGLRSTDDPVSSGFVAKTTAVTPAKCASCMGNDHVLVAFHWVADESGTPGHGWMIDSLRVVAAAANVVTQDFEPPAYDMLVIGSDASTAQLAKPDVARLLADFVAYEGGRLLVLGGTSGSTAWLAPLLHTGAREPSAVIVGPDPTNPLLNVPNELGYSNYAKGTAWDFTGSLELGLFDQIDPSTSGSGLNLGASTLGAFGHDNSSVILSSYLPYTMSADESQRFFTNAILHARYAGLFAEFGPNVPQSSESVASVARTAVIKSGDEHVEMTITMYVWPGPTSAQATGTGDVTPSRPDVLTLTGGGPITLSWSEPASLGSPALTRYDIYRGNSFGTETFLASTGTNRSFVDREVTLGNSYFYNVTAVNSKGASSASPDAQKFAATASTIPRTLGATGGSHQISLEWTEPSDKHGSAISAYKIYRGASSGAETLLATIGANTSYVDAGLANGVTRYYKVTAVNGGGESDPSAEASAATFNVPIAPDAPVVTPGVGQLAVHWGPPPETNALSVSNYYLYIGDSSGAESATPIEFGSSGFDYTDSGLADGQTRYYEVAAKNALGMGARSSESWGTTLTTSSPPTLLTATRGAGTIHLSWTPPVDLTITAYKIYAGALAGTESLIATVGTSPTTYDDAPLAASQTRFYTVTAVNPVGESLHSNEATATTYAVPTAPLVLAATSGVGQISLTWTVPASDGGTAVTDYKIYRSSSSGAETYLASTGGPNATFVDATLGTGVTRYYNVTAVNAAGEGASSIEAFATTPGAPTAPLAPVATGGAGQISLSWNAPASDGGSAITNYKIYRGTATGAESYLASTGSNNLSFVDATLTASQTRYYKISAVSAAAEGAQSTEAIGVTSGVPTAPLVPAATGGVQKIDLSWNAPASNGGSAITNYKIYRASSSGAEVYLASTGGTNLTFSDQTIAASTTRFYTVTAVSAAGESAQSTETSASTNGVPGAALALVPTAGANQISLAWNAPASDGGSAVTNYKIYRSSSSGAETYLASTGGTNRTFVDATLTPSATRYYTVLAVNLVGDGAQSTENSATTYALPGQPLLPGATGGAGTITLSWSAPVSNGGSAITNYYVYRATTSGGTSSYLGATGGSNTTFVDATLGAGVTRYYKISAVTAAGEGSPTAEFSATTATASSVPSSVAATAGANQISLSWSAPTDSGGASVTNYKVYRGTLTTQESYLTSTGGSNTTFVDATLGTGVTRYYTIVAVNGVGDSAQSAEVSTTTWSLPGLPTSLTATTGVGSLALSWTAPASNGGGSITNYYVYRGTSANGETLLTPSGIGGSNTSFTDATLGTGVTRYYKVSAYTAAGEGSQSVEASGTTATASTAPLAPVATGGANQISLSWNAPASTGGSAITNYKIYRGAGVGTETYLGATGGNNATFIDATLTPSVTRYYNITAVNGVGESATSTETFATTYALAGAPQSPAAAKGINRITISWSAPLTNGGAAVSDYKIYRSTSSGAESYLATIGGTNTSFIDATINDNSARWYKVAAVTAAGDGTQSNEVTSTRALVAGAPTLVIATAASSHRMSVSWSAPGDNGGDAITSYKVYAWTTNAPYSAHYAGSTSTTAYTDTSPTGALQTWYYQVTAVNGVGEGAASTAGSGITT